VRYRIAAKRELGSEPLCSMAGADPTIGQTGVVGAPRGTKINCSECRTMWCRLRELNLRWTDFVPAKH